jgi:hypothetical protein
MSKVPEFVRQRMKQSPSGDHPEANLLAAFAEGALTGREHEQVLAHLSTCGSCREIVAIAMPEAATATAPVTKQWARWPMLRWAGVTAAVVVVAAAVVVQKSRQVEFSKQSAPSPVATPAAREKTPVDSATQREAAPFAERAQAKEENKRADARLRAESSDKKPATKSETKKDVVAEADLDTKTMNAAPSAPAPSSMAKALQPRETPLQAYGPMQMRDEQAAGLQAQASAGAGGAVGGVVRAPEQKQHAVAPTPPPASANEAVGVAAKTNAVEIQKEKRKQSEPEVDRLVAAPAKPQSMPRRATGDATSAVAGEAVPASSAPLAGAMMRSAVSLSPQWRLSSEGALERSLDAGRTWQAVRVAASWPALRALSSRDGDIWAGGKAGALYHSADNGRNWSRVAVKSADATLESDIVGVEFTDAQHGSVRTASGEAWITNDGGTTWSVRP